MSVVYHTHFFHRVLLKKQKLLICFFKVNFFMNITNWNQYNYFLKLEWHYIYHYIPLKQFFPSNQRKRFERYWFFGKPVITVKEVSISGKSGNGQILLNIFKMVICIKPLHQVSSQYGIYFKSQGVGHFCPTPIKMQWCKDPSQNTVKINEIIKLLSYHTVCGFCLILKEFCN